MDPEPELFSRLREMRAAATAESIGGDLIRARALVELASPEDRELADRHIHEMERLERWLRDR